VTGTLGESLVDEIDGQMKNRTGLDRLIDSITQCESSGSSSADRIPPVW